MTVVFWADLPVTDPDRGEAWTVADVEVRKWIGDRFGVEVDEPNQSVSRGTVQVEHRYRAGQAGRHATFAAAREDSGWRWSTTVWVLDADDAPLTVRIRLDVGAVGDATTALDRPVGRPTLVRALLDALDVRIDGFKLGTPLPIGAGDVDGLVALLLDTERRLPVVVATVAASDGGGVSLAGTLCQQVGGIAHVVDLGPDATWALSERLGRRLSVYDGGVRIYWPGATVRDQPRTHPLWTRRVIDAAGTDRFLGRVLRVLASASALHDRTPALVLALQGEQRAAEQAAAAQRLADLRQQAEQAVRDAGGVDDEFFDQVTSEYETTIQALTDERDEALLDATELREQVDRLREDLEAQRRSWAMVGNAVGSIAADDDAVDDPDEEPVSVHDAVRIADETCENLVFLPEAYAAAETSAFTRPDEVLAQLRALDRVAARLFDPSESKPIRDLCPEEGLSNFRTGISQTAFTQYAADYERQYDGATIVLDEHLATGTGAPNAIMRIYFTRDNVNNKLVVGHVGRKLRDRSNH